MTNIFKTFNFFLIILRIFSLTTVKFDIKYHKVLHTLSKFDKLRVILLTCLILIRFYTTYVQSLVENTPLSLNTVFYKAAGVQIILSQVIDMYNGIYYSKELAGVFHNIAKLDNTLRIINCDTSYKDVKKQTLVHIIIFVTYIFWRLALKLLYYNFSSKIFSIDEDFFYFLLMYKCVFHITLLKTILDKYKAMNEYLKSCDTNYIILEDITILRRCHLLCYETIKNVMKVIQLSVLHFVIFSFLNTITVTFFFIKMFVNVLPIYKNLNSVFRLLGLYGPLVMNIFLFILLSTATKICEEVR